MLLKLICCDVFARIACHIVSQSPHIVDAEFIPMLAHTVPAQLNKDLQKRIDDCSAQKKYDKIILGYGLCGNSTAGLKSPVPMIIPRVHDCCTLFMGSKENFLKEFQDNLSMRWCTTGYYERCFLNENPDWTSFAGQQKTTPEYMELVEKYGEDNAEYIWETLHPEIETSEVSYIKIEGFEFSDSLSGFSNKMTAQGKSVKILNGSTEYLERLINGPWDEKLFLHLEPGKNIVPVFDMDEVISNGQ